ncbi:hypothetical protein D3C76_1202070 [compost metagenome]
MLTGHAEDSGAAVPGDHRRLCRRAAVHPRHHCRHVPRPLHGLQPGPGQGRAIVDRAPVPPGPARAVAGCGARPGQRVRPAGSETAAHGPGRTERGRTGAPGARPVRRAHCRVGLLRNRAGTAGQALAGAPARPARPAGHQCAVVGRDRADRCGHAGVPAVMGMAALARPGAPEGNRPAPGPGADGRAHTHFAAFQHW